MLQCCGCYLATIANYIVYCEAVRSALLATVWLLVTTFYTISLTKRTAISQCFGQSQTQKKTAPVTT